LISGNATPGDKGIIRIEASHEVGWTEIKVSRSIIYVAIGIAFGAVTNGCAWVVLARMKSLGQDVGAWRWAQKDLVLYKDYWKMAKK